MGIFESVQRSQKHIDSLAGVAQDYFAKKRERERRERVKQLLTERSAVEAQPMTPAQTVEPSTTIGEEGFAGPVTREAGAVAPMRARSVQPTATGPSTTIGEEGFTGAIERQPVQVPTRMRGIQSANDVFALAEILGLSPGKTAEMATATEERNMPSYDILNQEGGGYTVFRKQRGKEPVVSSERAPVFRQQAAAIDYALAYDEQGKPKTIKQGDREFFLEEEYDKTQGKATGKTRVGKEVSDTNLAVYNRQADKDKRDLARQEEKEQQNLVDDFLKASEGASALERAYGGPEGIKNLQTQSVRQPDVEKILAGTSEGQREVLRSMFNETASQQGQVGRLYADLTGKRNAAQKGLERKGLFVNSKGQVGKITRVQRKEYTDAIEELTKKGYSKQQSEQYLLDNGVRANE